MASTLPPAYLDFVYRILTILVYEMDFAMWLMIEYAGKPDTTEVSLIQGPARDLVKAADTSKYDIRSIAERCRIRSHSCLQCSKCDWMYGLRGAPTTCVVRRDIHAEPCGAALRRVEFAPSIDLLAIHFAEGRELMLRVVVSQWLVAKVWGMQEAQSMDWCGAPAGLPNIELIAGLRRPWPELSLPLRDVLRVLASMMEDRVDTLLAQLGQHAHLLSLNGRRNLIPRGKTLQAGHHDYLGMREKIISASHVVVGLANRDRNSPDVQLPFVSRPRDRSTVDEYKAFAFNPAIPPPNGQPLADGPHKPSIFRWNGSECEMQPRPHRLLSYLWTRPDKPIEFGAVKDAVWGHDEQVSDEAVKGAVKKANRTMTDAGCPKRIGIKQGLITLS